MLEKVIEQKIKMGIKNRRLALKDIRLSIELEGMYNFAAMFNVLNEDHSAEDFAIEFFTAYNNEIQRDTY